MKSNNNPYLQTLLKTIAHKWSIHEVFLTSYEARSQTETTLYAELPRAHGFYCEYPLQSRDPDLALLIEVCRQACFVIAHTQFEVPLEGNRFQFLFQELQSELVSQEAMCVLKPTDIIIDSKIEKCWKRGTVTSGLLYVFSLRTNESPLANIRIRMTWIDREKWKEMRFVMRRGRNLPREANIPMTPKTTLTAADVGRINPENVVLQKVTHDNNVWIAIPLVDVRHPVLFDHPIDHIYAMVQLEACRQLAFFSVSRQYGCQAFELKMVGCTAHFISVAEFDLNTQLQARLCSADSMLQNHSQKNVEVKITQGSRIVSQFTLMISHNKKQA